MPDERYQQYHKALPESVRRWLRERSISDGVIDRFQIGWNGRSLTIPIFNRDGNFAFFKYRRDPRSDNVEISKYWCDAGSSPEVYGWEHIQSGTSPLIICEGELDRLVLESHGFPAISSTGGVGVFKEAWAQAIAQSVEVYVCFDNDEAGRMGAAKLAGLLPRAKIVLLPPEVGNSGDVTDYFIKLGKTATDFLSLLQQSKTLEQFNNEVALLMDDDVTTVHPSQDFFEERACFAVRLSNSVVSESKERNQERLMLVTSDRTLIDATDRQVLYRDHHLALADVPPLKDLESRWTRRHVLAHVRGFSPRPSEVYNRIRELYLRYIEFSDANWYRVIPLWVMGTYLFRIFEAYPYLAFTGLKNSGKSKTLELTSRLSFNGLTSVGISEASLFRLVAATRATIAVDEAELFHSRWGARAQGIRELLNAGHRKGTSVYRQVKDARGDFVTQRFEVYSPKLLASIEGLEDVLASRTLTVMMLRARTERGRALVTETSEDWSELRHLLYSFALTHFKEVREAYRSDPATRIANNRANDLWTPLLSLGTVVFETEPTEFQKLQYFARHQVDEARDENLDEISSALLEALNTLVVEDRPYTNREIAEQVRTLLEDGGPRDISSAVGHRLRRFGFAKQRLDQGVRYLIRKRDVEELLSRYLPSADSRLSAFSLGSTNGNNMSNEGMNLSERSEGLLRVDPEAIQVEPQIETPRR